MTGRIGSSGEGASVCSSGRVRLRTNTAIIVFDFHPRAHYRTGMSIKTKVGESIYVVRHGSVKGLVVTKVGRKYVTVADGAFIQIRFLIDSGEEVTSFDTKSKAYSSESEARAAAHRRELETKAMKAGVSHSLAGKLSNQTIESVLWDVRALTLCNE